MAEGRFNDFEMEDLGRKEYPEYDNMNEQELNECANILRNDPDKQDLGRIILIVS